MRGDKLIGMLNCEALWISIFIGRLFLRGHLCSRCDVILMNRKIYRQSGSGSQSKRQRGKLCMPCTKGSLGAWQYQQAVVYAAKRGQAQGIPTHTAAHWRRGQHTQLENTNTQVKKAMHAHNAKPRFAACNASSMPADPRMPHRCPPTGDPAVSTRLHVQADPNTYPACKAQSPPR